MSSHTPQPTWAERWKTPVGVVAYCLMHPLYPSRISSTKSVRFGRAQINVNSRNRLDILLLNPALDILLDTTLLAELSEVIYRPKFQRYISPVHIEQFINLLLERATQVDTISVIQVSPDPKDNFLLALCRDGATDFLLTGNKVDLLDLHRFDNTQILTLTEFPALPY